MPIDNTILQKIVDELAQVLLDNFTQPEYIPGCKITSIADVNEYSTGNGWVEAICGKHNNQRVRYKGVPANLAVDDFIDVLYFSDHKLFEIRGAGYTTASNIDQVLVSKLVSPDTLTNPVLFANNNGDLRAIGKLALGNAAIVNALDIEEDSSSTRIEHKNIASASDVNNVLYVQNLLTTVAQRTALSIQTRFNNITDAARNTETLIRTADNGLFDTTITLTGRESQFHGNVLQDSGKDIYPNGDEAGISERFVNVFFNPTDHFDSFSGWTWENVTFSGAPSQVDTSTYNSHLALLNSVNGTSHFAYQNAVGSGTEEIYLRCARGVGSEVGLRFDDGSNNNYQEIWLVDGTVAGTYRIKHVSRAGGGAVTTTFYANGTPPGYYILRLRVDSGSVFIAGHTQDSPLVPTIASGALAWNASRKGIIFMQGGSAVPVRQGLYDWVQVS